MIIFVHWQRFRTCYFLCTFVLWLICGIRRTLFSEKILTDSVTYDDTESTSLSADVTDDSCRVEYIEIVPLTRDTDDSYTTKCESGDCSAEVKQEMSTDSVSHDDTESASVLADVTDNCCREQYMFVVPLTRDTDGPCTTECDSKDWSAEVKQENLPAVKEEPDDVCCIV